MCSEQGSEGIPLFQVTSEQGTKNRTASKQAPIPSKVLGWRSLTFHRLNSRMVILKDDQGEAGTCGGNPKHGSLS